MSLDLPDMGARKNRGVSAAGTQKTLMSGSRAVRICTGLANGANRASGQGQQGSALVTVFSGSTKIGFGIL